MPADIDKESLARLPLLQRSDLDDKGKRVYDSLSGPESNGGPLRGPLGFAIYNPALAEALHLLHDSVIKEGALGARVNRLAIRPRDELLVSGTRMNRPRSRRSRCFAKAEALFRNEGPWNWWA